MADVLASGRNAIVAGRAVIHDTTVIEHRTNKGGGVMTHPAILSRSDMCSGLANSGGTVVAACAIARNAVVIKDRWEKRCRVMAEVAVLSSWYMIHC